MKKFCTMKSLSILSLELFISQCIEIWVKHFESIGWELDIMKKLLAISCHFFLFELDQKGLFSSQMNDLVDISEVREDIINMSDVSFRVLYSSHIQNLRLSVFN